MPVPSRFHISALIPSDTIRRFPLSYSIIIPRFHIRYCPFRYYSFISPTSSPVMRSEFLILRGFPAIQVSVAERRSYIKNHCGMELIKVWDKTGAI
jgi:hypothetical protein